MITVGRWHTHFNPPEACLYKSGQIHFHTPTSVLWNTAIQPVCAAPLNICEGAFHRAWIPAWHWPRRGHSPERDGPCLSSGTAVSWCVHTPMIIHSGFIVLHISPLARHSVTVADGHTWVIHGFCSVDKRAEEEEVLTRWRVPVSFTLALNRK